MSRNYRRGRSFEYAVRKKLCEAGFFAIRSPASKSPVDVVALSPGATLLVQCKTDGSLPKSEWNRLFELAVKVGAVPILARRPGVELVRMTGRKSGRRKPGEVLDERGIYGLAEPNGSE